MHITFTKKVQIYNMYAAKCMLQQHNSIKTNTQNKKFNNQPNFSGES